MIEHANVVKTTCTGGNVCFTAGTLIHTIHGLKPIETITHGDLIWSRQEFGDEYDYRPVIATKATPNQEIYEVVVKHSNNSTETFKTTKEHPFWVEGIGWLKASLLEQGMTLLDKHGLPNVTILSQTKLTHTDTVYNFEVQDFHTYHIGEYGVWVHNADCCDLKDGYTSSPTLSNDPYNLNVVNNRVGETKVYFNVVRKAKVEINGQYYTRDVDLSDTLQRISRNDKSLYPNDDGKPYLNKTKPKLKTGVDYTEWTVPTQGIGNRGSQRIVIGSDGSMHYTPDHYKSWIQLK